MSTQANKGQSDNETDNLRTEQSESLSEADFTVVKLAPQLTQFQLPSVLLR